MTRHRTAGGALFLALATGLLPPPTPAADHLDAPLIQTDGRVDINDVYAFISPANSNNTVLIITVNPLLEPGDPAEFNRKGKYELLIDNDFDAKKEVKLKLKFGAPDQDGIQTVKLRGSGFKADGLTGENITVSRKGEDVGMLTTGIYDDPFFFDLLAFRGTGGRDFCDGNETDFFAGLNVSAIVLEVPTTELLGKDGLPLIGVWANTKAGKIRDRMGRPAINTVLIPAERKDEFNKTKPNKDRKKFSGAVTDTLKQFYDENDPADAAAIESLADILLPDILTFDTAFPDGILNGRRLADDVIDAELFLITGGLSAGGALYDSDCVDGNDKLFLSSFPYLAPPH